MGRQDAIDEWVLQAGYFNDAVAPREATTWFSLPSLPSLDDWPRYLGEAQVDDRGDGDSEFPAPPRPAPDDKVENATKKAKKKKSVAERRRKVDGPYSAERRRQAVERYAAKRLKRLNDHVAKTPRLSRSDVARVRPRLGCGKFVSVRDEMWSRVPMMTDKYAFAEYLASQLPPPRAPRRDLRQPTCPLAPAVVQSESEAYTFFSTLFA